MNTLGKRLLRIGAWLNFGIALAHVAIAAVGPRAYLYTGRADLAAQAQAGSRLPALLTLGLAFVFLVFGLYALSGAGLIRRLPLLRVGLLAIGSLYTLRGLIVILDILRLVRGAGYPLRQTVFSALALAVGVLYLLGAGRQWRALGAGPAARS